MQVGGKWKLGMRGVRGRFEVEVFDSMVGCVNGGKEDDIQSVRKEGSDRGVRFDRVSG